MPKLAARILLASLLAGCLNPPTTMAVSFTSTPSSTPTQTPLPPTATLTPTSAPIPSPTPTQTPEPTGCLKPPEDYTRLEVNGWTVNQRTLAMLTHARELYAGESGDRRVWDYAGQLP